MVEGQEIVFVKLGGSVITDKSVEEKADIGKIYQLTKELHEARIERQNLIVLAHGAGSFGHIQAARYRTHEGITHVDSQTGIAKVRQAVFRLNQIILNVLIETGEPAVTISPFSFLTTSSGKINKSFITPFTESLRSGLLPITHGDVVLDQKMGCAIVSGEQVLNYLAINLRPFGASRSVIEIGNTNGVYDKNGTTIACITKDNYQQIKQEITASSATDVTGGMAHKVEEALNLTRFGIPTLLISADAGHFRDAILGGYVSGTWIRE